MNLKKLDEVFSKYIKLRDAQNGIIICPTCGILTMCFDCGHFVKRQNLSTRWDERNANAQCIDCNRFKDGKYEEHAWFINSKYGSGTSQELERIGKQTIKLTKFDILQKIDYFSKKIKEYENN